MRQRIIAATPMISLLLFLMSGFVLGEWLLGLTAFLLMPLSTLLLSGNFKKRLNQFMPLIALAIFLWIAIGLNAPHPGWVVFLLIPISNIVLEGHINARQFVTLSITILYVVLGLVLDDFWHPGWLMLLLIPIFHTLFFPTKTVEFFTSGKEGFKRTINDYIHVESDDDH